MSMPSSAQQTQGPIPCCSLPTRWTQARQSRLTTRRRCTSWRGLPPATARRAGSEICGTALHRVLAGTHVQHRHRWRRGRGVWGASSDLIRATARRCSSGTERALGCFIEVTLFFGQKTVFCWNLILVRFKMVAMLAALLRNTRAARNIWINKRTKWKHAKEALTVSDLAWICQHHLQQNYIGQVTQAKHRYQ
jgi:hypothetical protein